MTQGDNEKNEEIKKIEKYSQKLLEFCTNLYVCLCVCVCVCIYEGYCCVLLCVGRISGV